MRGKTNILPMVGGYVNAPIEEFVAGENLQLGDLVEKAYSDVPQQLKGDVDTVANSGKLHPLFDGKFVAFLDTTNKIEVALVEKSAEAFNVTNIVLYAPTIYMISSMFVPVDDRTFVIFIKLKETFESSWEYFCKKVVYDGVDFTVSDITYNVLPDFPSNTGYRTIYWCVGNGGTLFISNAKLYYLSVENNVVKVIGGTTLSFENSNAKNILYLPTQDLFIVFGRISTEPNYCVAKIDTINDNLVVSENYETSIDIAENFSDGIIGIGIAENNLIYATVDDEGIITIQDIYSLGQSYNHACIIPFQDYFVVCNEVRTTRSNWSYFDYTYKVFYYNNGFILGDTKSYETSYSGTVYYNGALYFNYNQKGFILSDTQGNSYGKVKLVFQEMLGDEFATIGEGFRMVKAQHHVDGVIKTGGNAGDTIEVYVPQLSS